MICLFATRRRAQVHASHTQGAAPDHRMKEGTEQQQTDVLHVELSTCGLLAMMCSVHLLGRPGKIWNSTHIELRKISSRPLGCPDNFGFITRKFYPDKSQGA